MILPSYCILESRLHFNFLYTLFTCISLVVTSHQKEEIVRKMDPMVHLSFVLVFNDGQDHLD
jgi:hypothetical protein